MNHSKISIPVVVFISITTVVACSVASTNEIRKRRIPIQLKPIQLLFQSQHGKTLGKTAAGTVVQKAPDSTEMYNWQNEEWKKYSSFKFSYDNKDRITGMSLVLDDDGFEEQIIYEYEPDGITLRQLSVVNWGLGGELFDLDTMYSVIKYYPGYANSMGLINSDITIYDVATVFKTFNNLDSVVSFDYELDDEGGSDTLHKFSTRYTKTGSKSVRANIQTYSEAAPSKLMSYYADYIKSGNDVLDTLKCIQHISADMDSEYAAMLTEVQYMMYTVRKNQQGKIIEQTTMTGTDSNFTDFTKFSTVKVYYNSSDDIDSCVSLVYDKDSKSWKNSEKVIYSYKKIIAGMQRSPEHIQALQQVTFEKNHGTMYLNIPGGMTVYALEQLDIQGRIVSRSVVSDSKTKIVLNPVSKNSTTVNLVRLKTNKGDLTCKMSPVK